MDGTIPDDAILAAAAARVRSALALDQLPPHALIVDGVPLGHFDAARHARLAAFTDVLERRGDHLAFRPALATPDARTRAFDAIARTLATEGALTAWRNERYAVVASFGDPPAFLVERAAARYLGIHTFAAHANGLVRIPDAGEPRMWLARRSPTKAIDPSYLDNLVGGGVAAGESPHATLVREAWEEAGIERALADQAMPCGTVHVERHVPDGLQRETIFAYDLWLPATFVPANQDGEVVEHRLVDFPALARLLANDRGREALTVDASVVALDCLRRAMRSPARRSPAAARQARE
jgi:8-oxo-dGTP pyrophosphatase MutT (NUDIX family)